MIHNDQISSFFEYTAKRQYFLLFLIANAKAGIICLTAIVKMCSISYSIFKCFYLTHFFTLLFIYFFTNFMNFPSFGIVLMIFADLPKIHEIYEVYFP